MFGNGTIQLMSRRIDISYKTIIFIAIFSLAIWIFFQILDVLLLFFVAFIFMSALSPLVDRLIRWGVPKTGAVILMLVLFFAILGLLLGVGVTPLVSQTGHLYQKLAEALNGLLQTNLINQSTISQQVSLISTQALGVTLDVVKNLVSFISVIVVTLYMLLYKEKMESLGTSLFISNPQRARKVLELIESKLGAWLRGQIVLSVTIGVMVYIGLFLIGIDFALPLAILAALLEVVPVIGPIISAIPAVLLALTVSPVVAVIVAVLYMVIQQLEGHLIVPQVMKRAVGLNPLLVILAISVGGRLLGVGGALLAVPIAVVVQLILQEGLSIELE